MTTMVITLLVVYSTVCRAMGDVATDIPGHIASPLEKYTAVVADASLHHTVDLTYGSLRANQYALDSYISQDGLQYSSLPHSNNKVTSPPPIKATTYGLPKPVFIPRHHKPMFQQSHTGASRRIITNKIHPYHHIKGESGLLIKTTPFPNVFGSGTNVMPKLPTSTYGIPKQPTMQVSHGLPRGHTQLHGLEDVYPSNSYLSTYAGPPYSESNIQENQKKLYSDHIQDNSLHNRLPFTIFGQYSEAPEIYQGDTDNEDYESYKYIYDSIQNTGVQEKERPLETQIKQVSSHTQGTKGADSPDTSIYSMSASPSSWIPINAPEGSVPARAYDIPAPDLSQHINGQSMFQQQDGVGSVSVLHMSYNTRPHDMDRQQVYKGKSEEVVSAVVLVKQK